MLARILRRASTPAQAACLEPYYEYRCLEGLYYSRRRVTWNSACQRIYGSWQYISAC